MKKKIIIISIIFVIVLLTLTVVFTNKDKDSTKNKSEDITFNIKKETLTKDGATFIIKNNTDKSYYYGENYTLERKESNKWTTLKLKDDIAWIDIIYNLEEKEETEIKVTWSDIYGILSKGKYRVVKNLNEVKESNTKKIYAEFEIK